MGISAGACGDEGSANTSGLHGTDAAVDRAEASPGSDAPADRTSPDAATEDATAPDVTASDVTASDAPDGGSPDSPVDAGDAAGGDGCRDCEPGYTRRYDSCDVPDTPLACGQTPCSPNGPRTVACVDGACQQGRCYPGYELNDVGYCVSTSGPQPRFWCGTEGAACAVGAGELCGPAGCMPKSECVAPLVRSTYYCVDPAARCAVEGCQPSQEVNTLTRCVQGQCVDEPFCPDGTEPCGSTRPPQCVRPGTCGVVCRPGCPTNAATCSGGVCVPKPGWVFVPGRLAALDRYLFTERDVQACGRADSHCSGFCEAGACRPSSELEFVKGVNRPRELTVAGGRLYFTDPPAGTVNAVNTATGALEVLAQGQATPEGLALDATHVYWANRAGNAVLRRALAGGDPEVFAAAATPVGVAANSRFVYWADTGTGSVRAKPKAGGAIEVIGQGHRIATESVTADEDRVVFVLEFDRPPASSLPSPYGKVVVYEIATRTSRVIWEEDGGNVGFFEPPLGLTLLDGSLYSAWGDVWDLDPRERQLMGTPLLTQNLPLPQTGVAKYGNDLYFGTVRGRTCLSAPVSLVDFEPMLFGRVAVDAEYLYFPTTFGFIGRVPR